MDFGVIMGVRGPDTDVFNSPTINVPPPYYEYSAVFGLDVSGSDLLVGAVDIYSTNHLFTYDVPDAIAFSQELTLPSQCQEWATGVLHEDRTNFAFKIGKNLLAGRCRNITAATQYIVFFRKDNTGTWSEYPFSVTVTVNSFEDNPNVFVRDDDALVAISEPAVQQVRFYSVDCTTSTFTLISTLTDASVGTGVRFGSAMACRHSFPHQLYAADADMCVICDNEISYTIGMTYYSEIGRCYIFTDVSTASPVLSPNYIEPLTTPNTPIHFGGSGITFVDSFDTFRLFVGETNSADYIVTSPPSDTTIYMFDYSNVYDPDFTAVASLDPSTAPLTQGRILSGSYASSESYLLVSLSNADGYGTYVPYVAIYCVANQRCCGHCGIGGDIAAVTNSCAIATCTGSGAVLNYTRDCDDGNLCTTDVCNPITACQHLPVAPGTICEDDGDSCTADECNAYGCCIHTVASCSPTPTPTISFSSTSSATQTPTPSITPSPTSSITPTQTPTTTQTISASPTPTASVTPSQTATVTSTQSASATPSPSATPSITPSNTPTSTETPSPTISFSTTNTLTATPTASVTPTPTTTMTLSATPTVSNSETPTPSVTASPTQTDSVTPTPSISESSSPAASQSATPTISNSPTATPTPTGSDTPSATTTPSLSATPTPSNTPSLSESGTPTPSATSTVSSSSTPTPSTTSTASLSSSPTASTTPSATVTPSSTSSPTSTVTGSNTPTSSVTPTRTQSGTRTPSQTPTQTPTPTRTQTPTQTNTPSNTRTPSNTPTPSMTSTASVTSTGTPSQTPSRTASTTSTASRSRTPSGTPTTTSTASSSNTPTRSDSSTATPSPTTTRTRSTTSTLTATPSSTRTSDPTLTATPTPTSTETPSATTGASASVTPTVSESPSTTPSPTSTETLTATPTPSETPSPTISISATPTPSVTSSVTPTISESATPSITPGFSQSITSSVTPTPSVTPSNSPTSTITASPTPSPSPIGGCASFDSECRMIYDPYTCEVTDAVFGAPCTLGECNGFGNCFSTTCNITDDTCIGVSCAGSRALVFEAIAAQWATVDKQLNAYGVNGNTSLLDTVVGTVINYVYEVKTVKEWIQEATILIHRHTGPCFDDLCSTWLADILPDLSHAYMIFTELLANLSLPEAHDIGINDIECLPGDGNFFGTVVIEDLIKINDHIDNDMNDANPAMQVCVFRTFNTNQTVLSSVETDLVTKGSWFSHRLELSLNGSFAHLYPQITHVHSDKLLNVGSDSVTRVYLQNRMPSSEGWQESANIVTLINDTALVLEDQSIIGEHTQSERVINTGYTSARCPAYFTRTVITPSSSTIHPLVELGVPPVYLVSVVNSNRISSLALPDTGTTNPAFNAVDFSISVFNIPTMMYVPTRCFYHAYERVNITLSHPYSVTYTNWLKSGGVCATSGCMDWYQYTPDPSKLCLYSLNIDQYGICFS